MARSHNKKRNVGIIYEQVMSFICEKLMEDNSLEAEKAINIIKENFNNNTQLRKEFKLFKALAETHDITGNLANLIISEAKSACNKMFDSQKLEKEKSKLIKDLNPSLMDGIMPQSSVISKLIDKQLSYRISKDLESMGSALNIGISNNKLLKEDNDQEYDILIDDNFLNKEDEG